MSKALIQPRMAGRAPRARPIACVMGDGDLVRALGLAGISSALVAPPDSPLLHSRFVRQAFPWTDLWAGRQELLAELLRFGGAQATPPVLFYQQDAQLLLLARQSEALSRVFRFVLPKPELVEDLVDKSRFQALAGRVGLPVPAARRIRAELGRAPPDPGLRFPVVIKPLVRDGDWHAVAGTSKALESATRAQFKAHWPALTKAGLEVLVQEMVLGPESRIESYHAYVDAEGRIAGEFTGRKIRTFPARFGHSTALETTDAADVAELGREVLRRIDLRGIAKLDFKRDAEGRLWLLEVNPRFNLWHHLGAVAGVNLPAMVFADLAGEPRPRVARARPGLRWCRPSQDWRAAREAGISFPAWLAWALRCEAKTVAWDDPLPYLASRFRHRPAGPDAAPLAGGAR